MAIALDVTTAGGGANAASLTWSHTCTGSNLILFVAVAIQAIATAGARASTVTYNTVAMTKISAKVDAGTDEEVSLWYLVGPSTGANNVVVTPTTATAFIVGHSISYTGASQTGVPDASGVGGVTVTTSYSQSLNSIADNCWGIWSVLAEGVLALTEGANTTRRQYDTGFLGLYLADTNSPKTPAGTDTMNVTSASQSFMSVMATFAPAGAAVTSLLSRRMRMGIG